MMGSDFAPLDDRERVDRRLDEQLIEGETLTSPSLLMGQGGQEGLVYVVDVRIAGFDDPILSVPVATGNRDLIYAEPGSAVLMRRNAAGGGMLEVVGFSKRKPGRRVLVPVDVDGMVAGQPEDVTVTARRFTYGELSDPNFGQGYGYVPYGAYGVFKGDQLVMIRGGK